MSHSTLPPNIGNITETFTFNSNNKPVEEETITKDDAAWILANAFLILTMQTGFGMLEAGCVSSKNVANIMVKNVIDVTLGGMTYWALGYGLSFGRPSNQFCGFGDFFFSATKSSTMGSEYSHYVFHFSFATASTTIVSGAVAERMKFTSYMIFSAINTFIYALPASWIWNTGYGFLARMGFYDFAGACVVHMVGGSSALVAAYLLGPRIGRFDKENNPHSMSSPVTALTGTFMLWWAWLSFNCGSTFGISGNNWKIAAKVAVNTLNGSIGGSLAGLIIIVAGTFRSGIYFSVPDIITGVLGGLLGVTGCCAVISPAESIFIGLIGGATAIGFTQLLARIKVDDPVGAAPVHLGAGMWSIIAVGLFGYDEFNLLGGQNALFHGGGWYLLGVEMLGAVIVASWSMITTAICFTILKKTLGIRMTAEEEILGADWVEHRVRSENFAQKLEKAILSVSGESGADAVMKNLLSEVLSGNTQQGIDGRIRNIAGSQPSDFVAEEISNEEMRKQAAKRWREAVHNVHKLESEKTTRVTPLDVPNLPNATDS